MTAAKKITYADRPAQATFEGRSVRLLRDQILILYDFIRDARGESKTDSGLLYVPNTAKEPGTTEGAWATVVAAGPGRYMDKWLDQERGHSHVGSPVFVENEIKAGMRIMVMGPLCGDAVMIDGLEHRVCCSDVALMVEEA